MLSFDQVLLHSIFTINTVHNFLELCLWKFNLHMGRKALYFKKETPHALKHLKDNILLRMKGRIRGREQRAKEGRKEERKRAMEGRENKRWKKKSKEGRKDLI